MSEDHYLYSYLSIRLPELGLDFDTYAPCEFIEYLHDVLKFDHHSIIDHLLINLLLYVLKQMFALTMMM